MSFSTDVHRIAKDMEATAEQLAAAVFITIFNNVIADTPVDEGRLRGNWQTTKDSPAASDINRIQKPKRSGPATDEVNAKVNKPAVYYLTNNLPYAERIEYGYSKVKAPEGMVRKNVLRLDSILRKHSK